MCGRFTLTVSKETLAHYLQERFDLDASKVEYEANYNTAPSQKILSVIFDGSKYRVGYLNWGYLAPKKQSHSQIMINARSETIDKLPSFKNAFKTKRCLIIADGFYEWDRHKKDKQPYRFTLNNHDLFTFAGIYNSYQTTQDAKTFGGLIVTTNANNDISFLHDRMPVIIPEDKQSLWLDSKADTKDLKGLLDPIKSPSLSHYPVSKEVNKPSYNKLEAIKEVKL
ncbi:MAG: SOS response-associated peptidase [Candidatus Izemoplasmataceae bacterium]